MWPLPVSGSVCGGGCCPHEVLAPVGTAWKPPAKVWASAECTLGKGTVMTTSSPCTAAQGPTAPELLAQAASLCPVGPTSRSAASAINRQPLGMSPSIMHLSALVRHSFRDPKM